MMPEAIQELVYKKSDDRDNRGDKFEFYVYDEQYPPDEHPEGGEIINVDKSCGYVTKRGVDLISDWLMDNGAKLHEEVIIEL